MITYKVNAWILGGILMLFAVHPAYGQMKRNGEKQINYADLVQQSFGIDQELVNGTQYFDRYTNYRGVPYFLSVAFEEGTLILQDRVYGGIKLRYDILAQNLEIEYYSPYVGYNWLVIVTDHVEGFEIRGFPFRKLELEEPGEKFYQVIQTGQFTCYVHWEKKLQALLSNPLYAYEFSDSKSTCLLEMNDRIAPFRNRATLVAQFPEQFQKEIKRLLKRNRFKVKGATPGELVQNMHAVSNLVNIQERP